MTKKIKRTSRALRDVLFDEIDALRNGGSDPTQALAVANLAKQIVNVVKVELDFHRQALEHHERGLPMELGQMQLGSQNASSVERRSTEVSDDTADTPSAQLQS